MCANCRFVNTRAMGQGNFQKSLENHSWSQTLVRTASFRGKAKGCREEVFETCMEQGLLFFSLSSDVKQKTKERIQITMRQIVPAPKQDQRKQCISLESFRSGSWIKWMFFKSFLGRKKLKMQNLSFISYVTQECRSFISYSRWNPVIRLPFEGYNCSKEWCLYSILHLLKSALV